MKHDMKKEKAVLAYGEVSGHSHQILSPVLHRKNEVGLAQEIIIDKQVELVHEEHDTNILEKGEVFVIVQREYDPIEGIRQVLD